MFFTETGLQMPAKYSFVLFLKVRKLPLNKKTSAFEKKYDVIYGNYVIAYLEGTDLI